MSHITFYLEDDDRKKVNFKNETISFNSQSNKIQKIKELKNDSTQKRKRRAIIFNN